METDCVAAVFGLGIRYGSGCDQVGIVYKKARVHAVGAIVQEKQYLHAPLEELAILI